MIQLVKELKKEKENTLKNSTEVITETNRLLEVGNDKDKEILRNSGLTNQIVEFEGDKKATYIERKALDEKYENDVFSLEEIKNICIKYGLRFLHATNYTGTVASHVPVKLREFCEKNNIGTGTNLESQVYVMGTDDCFKLEKQKKINIKQYFELDPILFYRIDQNTYKLIAKWGKDLTIWNYIKAFRRRSVNHYGVINSIILAIVGLFFIYSLNPLANLWWILLPIVVSIMANAILIYIYEDNSHKFTRDEIWNSRTQMGGI